MACTVLGLCRNSGKSGSIQPLSVDPRLEVLIALRVRTVLSQLFLSKIVTKTQDFRRGKMERMGFVDEA